MLRAIVGPTVSFRGKVMYTGGFDTAAESAALKDISSHSHRRRCRGALDDDQHQQFRMAVLFVVLYQGGPRLKVRSSEHTRQNITAVACKIAPVTTTHLTHRLASKQPVCGEPCNVMEKGGPHVDVLSALNPSYLRHSVGCVRCGRYWYVPVCLRSARVCNLMRLGLSS